MRADVGGEGQLLTHGFCARSGSEMSGRVEKSLRNPREKGNSLTMIADCHRLRSLAGKFWGNSTGFFEEMNFPARTSISASLGLLMCFSFKRTRGEPCVPTIVLLAARFYLIREGPRGSHCHNLRPLLLGFRALAEELLDLPAKTSVVGSAPQRRPLKIVQLTLDLVVDHGYFPRGPVPRRRLVSD